MTLDGNVKHVNNSGKPLDEKTIAMLNKMAEIINDNFKTEKQNGTNIRTKKS